MGWVGRTLGIVVLTLSGWLPGGVVAAVLPGNFLPNPELELDENGDGTPDGWYRTGTVPQDARWDSSRPVSGNHHLLLHDQRTQDWSAWGTAVELPRFVPEVELQWSWGYEFASQGRSDPLQVTVYWQSEGEDLGDNRLLVGDNQPEYVTVNKVLVVPDGTTHVRVEFATGPEAATLGTAWIDDVSMSVPGAGTYGDLDGDGRLNAGDLDVLSDALVAGNQHAFFDLNGDALVDFEDREFWVEWIKLSYFGDANLDFVFDSRDLIQVFQAGEYEDGIDANSTWATGDWSGDFEFDSADMIVAFQTGSFEQGMRASIAAVPEPAQLSWGWSILISWAVLRCGVSRVKYFDHHGGGVISS